MSWVYVLRWDDLRLGDRRGWSFQGTNTFQMRLRQNLGGNEAEDRIGQRTTPPTYDYPGAKIQKGRT